MEVIGIACSVLDNGGDGCIRRSHRAFKYQKTTDIRNRLFWAAKMQHALDNTLIRVYTIYKSA